MLTTFTGGGNIYIGFYSFGEKSFGLDVHTLVGVVSW